MRMKKFFYLVAVILAVFYCQGAMAIICNTNLSQVNPCWVASVDLDGDGLIGEAIVQERVNGGHHLRQYGAVSEWIRGRKIDTPTSVPEPSTAILFLAGFLLLFLWRQRMAVE